MAIGERGLNDEQMLRDIFSRYHGHLDTLLRNADPNQRAQLALDLGFLIGMAMRLTKLAQRDAFAGQALVGVMVMRAAIRDQGYDEINQESIAEEAYEIADAMLEAREKR